MRKERIEGRKAYNGGQEATREHIFDVFFSSLLLAFFLGSCNRSLVVQVAYWAYAPNKERQSSHKTMRLIKSMRLTASSA